MGWVAINVNRVNTKSSEDLGNLTVFFPKVEKAIVLPNNGRGLKLEDLVFISDFPIESTLFAPGSSSGEYVSKLKSFGFPHVLGMSDYVGETWFLDNGSKIVFPESISSSDLYGRPTYYNNSNNILGRFTAGLTFPYGSVTPIAFQFSFLYFFVGDQEQLPLYWSYSLTESPINTVRTYPPGTDLLPYTNTNEGAKPLNFFLGVTPIVESTDPYDPGGETEPGGGTGDFDGTGDDISFSSSPTLSAVDAGFITLFNPSLTEMHNLANYMWSDLFDVNGWKKIFADPMNAILGLSIVPVNIPSGGTRAVKVGNISTGITMTLAGSQFVTVDCGTLNVNEFWGAYLDYDPYTKAEIYLPYIGTHPLSTDDIMSKPVHVIYNIDILSGACCAQIQCGGSVLYSFIGQCASSIPVTGDNWTNVINGVLSIAGSIGTMVATGGASAPMVTGNIASNVVNTLKPTVEKSGSMSGTGGMLGVQTPYLILTRPRQAVPKRQNEFTGYPSFITELLGDLTGYTEIEYIHLENVPATEPELSEIENLLKSGVIF